MGFFKSNRRADPRLDYSEDEPTTLGRPEGTVGDTGLRFSGWYGVASDTLLFASRDDDPRCQAVLCREAKRAAGLAEEAAVNPRQSTMIAQLQDAIKGVAKIAAETPPLTTPHTHDVSQNIGVL